MLTTTGLARFNADALSLVATELQQAGSTAWHNILEQLHGGQTTLHNATEHTLLVYGQQALEALRTSGTRTISSTATIVVWFVEATSNFFIRGFMFLSALFFFVRTVRIEWVHQGGDARGKKRKPMRC